MIKRLNPSHKQNFRAREGPCPLPSHTQQGELLRDDCPEGRLEPERLAADFTLRFQVPLRVSLDDLAMLLESAGIGPRLAKGLRDVHYSLPGGGYAIQYLEDQWEGGRVHTVLHETGEIVHEQVWGQRHDSKPPREICPEAGRSRLN